MAVDLNSIPTANTIEFTVTFFNRGDRVARIPYGGSDVLNCRFDAIGVGNGDPLSIYELETPGSYTISPGNLAFVDRSVNSKIALRYGVPGGAQQSIIFAMPA
ncbi:MAG: hypothetical protein JST82_04215 [Bacteroidetes bacterium]|nr:hypothetical protein [Bacteroidota bacterium]